MTFNVNVSRMAPMQIYGYNVIVPPPRQRVMLSDDVTVSDEFRAKFNEYLAGLFGYKELLEDGQVLVLEQTKTISMNQTTFNEVKRRQYDCRDDRFWL